MKYLIWLFILLPFAGQAQLDSATAHAKLREAAKPVYVKYKALVMELRAEVNIAKQGKLPKSEVVAHFNRVFGPEMGRETTFAGVDKRLTQAGDAYVEIKYLREQARIAFLWAADNDYKANH